MWVKLSKSKYKHSVSGHVIIKYKIYLFEKGYSWLLYEPNEDIMYGDYKMFDSLKEAKASIDDLKKILK